MKPLIFHIKKLYGKISEQSSADIKEAYSGLVDGNYELRITKVTRTYLTRYKFYFAYLLPEIIAAGRFVEINKETGEAFPMTCETFHDILKKHHNSNLATDPFNPGAFIRIPASTTKLSDGEFIDRYENEIAAHWQTELQLELMSRDEWIKMKKKEYRQS